MSAFYLLLTYLISSHYVVRLMRWWNAFHVTLIEWKLTSEVTKAKQELPIDESYFITFPKTWRSLWLELVRVEGPTETLRQLAEKTNLKSFCQFSETTHLESAVENFTALSVLGSQEEILSFLGQVPTNSHFWQSEFEPYIYQHQEAVLTIMSRLLDQGFQRQAVDTIKKSPPDAHLYLLSGLCKSGKQYFNFTVAQACTLSDQDQIAFIELALEYKVTIFPFIKYFKRFTEDAQDRIRGVFFENDWWLSQIVLAKPGKPTKVPGSIAWYFSNSTLEVIPHIIHDSHPDIVIAA